MQNNYHWQSAIAAILENRIKTEQLKHISSKEELIEFIARNTNNINSIELEKLFQHFPPNQEIESFSNETKRAFLKGNNNKCFNDSK